MCFALTFVGDFLAPNFCTANLLGLLAGAGLPRGTSFTQREFTSWTEDGQTATGLSPHRQHDISAACTLAVLRYRCKWMACARPLQWVPCVTHETA